MFKYMKEICVCMFRSRLLFGRFSMNTNWYFGFACVAFEFRKIKWMNVCWMLREIVVNNHRLKWIKLKREKKKEKY